MARENYELERPRDEERSAVREWVKLRVANIRDCVSAADVLARNGVTLRMNGAHSEQISCPFHGTDNHPSAKYFPDEGDSHSHVWCFVCRENWDAIGLWMKFTGTERFTENLRQMERAFGLTVPESPTTVVKQDATVSDPLADEVRHLFEVCENRLKEHRDRFELTSHLKLGALLDHTRFYLNQGQINHTVAKERLGLVLNRLRGTHV